MKTRSGYTSILTAFALSGAVLVSGCTSGGQGYTDEATLWRLCWLSMSALLPILLIINQIY